MIFPSSHCNKNLSLSGDNGSKQFGSCTHAKRSCGEKYGDGIASDDCNLTQFSFSKLGKQIKRE
jgi:hypothetical protein